MTVPTSQQVNEALRNCSRAAALLARIHDTTAGDPELRKVVATALEAIMDVEQLLRQRQSQSRRHDDRGTAAAPRSQVRRPW